MVRRFAVDGAVMGLTLGVVHAQDDMMGDEPPPPHPEVVLAPPEGFEPPEDMPPRMTGDPEADAGAMLDTFFQLMDADGSGAVDFEEFKAWVHHVHMPPQVIRWKRECRLVTRPWVTTDTTTATSRGVKHSA